MCPGRDRLVSVHPSRGEGTNGRFLIFHHPHLHGRGMGSECDVWIFLDKKSILHLTSRVIFWEVQRRKVVPIVLNLRALGKIKSDALKDFDDALSSSSKGMDRSQWGIGRRQGQVDIGRLLFLVGRSNFLNQGVKFFFCKLLYPIDELTIRTFFLIWNAAHSSHQFSDHTFFGNKFHSVGLQLVWGTCVCCSDGSFDGFDFLLIHELPVNPVAKVPISKFLG